MFEKKIFILDIFRVATGNFTEIFRLAYPVSDETCERYLSSEAEQPDMCREYFAVCTFNAAFLFMNFMMNERFLNACAQIRIKFEK